MSILSFADIGVEFGATILLQNVTFTVDPGERWGIVGRSGAGKTTLFRLITGDLAPARGTIARQPGLRLALLDQDRVFGGAATVWEAAASGYRDLLALEVELARQGERLAALGDRVTGADLARYGRDQERFAHGGGYQLHARVDAVLQGLGFDPESARTRPLASLSGGERGRIGLAAQLAAPADLVLLDEPTNHLDLGTTAWLRDYLAEFGETVLVISHDRAFLDDTVDHVLHVSARSATAYRGGYSAFVTQRDARRLALEREVARQDKAIAREEDYIRRNLAGRNSAQARGRRARLARLPRLSPPPGEAGALTLNLEIAERGGDQALVAERLTVAVGDRVLVREFSAVARRGEVIALVGPNGAGKTTLLATLLGARPPAAGQARRGGAINAEWFRQDLAQVPDDRSIYDCIAELRPAWNRGAIQNLLGCFGFSGDEVQRSTAVLSGGERARVALALLMLGRANLLVLDEPTNHLDVESIEAIEDALEDYEGTVILVSHDRAFLRELATRVWAFDGDRIDDYPGTFLEWEEHDARRAARRAAAISERAATSRKMAKAQTRLAALERQVVEEAYRGARRGVEWLERWIQQHEDRIAELTAALADPALHDGTAAGARRAGQLDAELRQARGELDAAMARWAAAVEALDRTPGGATRTPPAPGTAPPPPAPPRSRP
ncbi:MAG TPA: ABC-F family ATP-binding cassette domain-containing protein [Gemmatimonadales bacterium]|nr:ABC-F family ATP-binding cassette domain-containing protein [Gemmatimonadales bacterium]